MPLLPEIKGYREAVELETTARDAAFLGLDESINGFEVRMLTLRHLLTLQSIGEPVINGEIPDPVELFNFLWVISPEFSSKLQIRKRRFMFQRANPKEKLSEAIRELSLADIAKTICEARAYLKETFMDAPPRSQSSSGISYYSSACNFIGIFGRECGYQIETVLEMPLKCAFQLVKEMQHAHGKKTMFNPSDRIKSEWLDALNRKN